LFVSFPVKLSIL